MEVLMSKLAESVRDLTGLRDTTGRRKYKEILGENVIVQIEEQSARIDGLESTVKTMNGMAQLAVQQMTAMREENAHLKQRMGILNKQIEAMRALMPPEQNGEASEGEEEKAD